MMFDLDQVGAILPAAEAVIQEEREDWGFAYKVIEDYVAAQTQFDIEQGIFIGGSVGVDLLLGKPRTLNDYTYHLYSRQALQHVNDLTNLLTEAVGARFGAIPELLDKARSAYKAQAAGDRSAQKLIAALRDPKIVVMKTSLPYQRYAILVDGRLMVQMTSLPKGSAAIVKPALVQSFESGAQNSSGQNKVYVISPEVQLLDLYRTLYSPAKAAEWKIALHDEINLYQHLKQRLGNLKSGAVDTSSEYSCEDTGTDLYRDPDLVEGGKDQASRNQASAHKLLLLSNWITGGSMVLIGEYGIQLALGEFGDDQRAMLQIVTELPLEEVMAQAKAIVLKEFSSAKCTYQIKPLVIMQDFRLQRAALRVDEHEILYAYNCAAYDLVPFNIAISKSKKAIRVGNPFVLMRFMLVDFWTVRLLAGEGHIDQNYAKLRLDSIVRQLLRLRSKISEMDEKSQTMSVGDKFLGQGGLLRVFPLESDSYLGTYEDEIQAQKNELKKGTRRFGDYYPDESKIRNGSYRKMDASSENNSKKKDGGYDILGDTVSDTYDE
jgi:hypothetical protein